MTATGAIGSGSKRVYERKPKGSHLDTVSYEINMLQFCFDNLPKDRGVNEPLGWLYLEGFLLHYRNLVEFFSGMYHGRDDDMSTAKPAVWAKRDLTAGEIRAIVEPARVLYKTYREGISKYLQHCTTVRYERAQTWRANDMKTALDAIIVPFRNAFLNDGEPKAI